jgi:hypothetical protein
MYGAVLTYLLVVPACLAFLELSLGPLRAAIQIVAWLGLAIAIATVLLVASARLPTNSLMLYNPYTHVRLPGLLTRTVNDHNTLSAVTPFATNPPLQ